MADIKSAKICPLRLVNIVKLFANINYVILSRVYTDSKNLGAKIITVNCTCFLLTLWLWSEAAICVPSIIFSKPKNVVLGKYAGFSAWKTSSIVVLTCSVIFSRSARSVSHYFPQLLMTFGSHPKPILPSRIILG